MSLIKETDMIWQKALLLHMHELYIFVPKYAAALRCVWLFLLSSYITLVQLQKRVCMLIGFEFEIYGDSLESRTRCFKWILWIYSISTVFDKILYFKYTKFYFSYSSMHTPTELYVLCFSKFMTISGLVRHVYYHESYISYPDT